MKPQNSLVDVSVSWFTRWMATHPEDKFLNKFASANGFSYKARGPIEDCMASILKMQGDLLVSNIVTGTYQNKSFRLFSVYLTIKSDKQDFWKDIVIEISLPNNLPSVLVTHSMENINASINNMGIDITNAFGKSVKVKTEVPQFNTIFVAHATPSNEIDALQVLTPNVIENLIENHDKFRDFETVGHKLYVYIDGSKLNAISMQNAFDVSMDLAKRLS